MCLGQEISFIFQQTGHLDPIALVVIAVVSISCLYSTFAIEVIQSSEKSIFFVRSFNF